MSVTAETEECLQALHDTITEMDKENAELKARDEEYEKENVKLEMKEVKRDLKLQAELKRTKDILSTLRHVLQSPQEAQTLLFSAKICSDITQAGSSGTRGLKSTRLLSITVLRDRASNDARCF
jgi:predicted RNase H-like nuclease (RuvC/YqgF family)